MFDRMSRRVGNRGRRWTGLVLATATVLAIGPAATAHDVAAEVDEVDQRMHELSGQLEAAERSHTDLARTLAETNTRMQQLRTELDAAVHEVEAADQEVATLVDRLQELSQQIERLEVQVGLLALQASDTERRLSGQAIEMYMGAASGDRIFPLGFASVEEGAVALSYLGDTAAETSRLLDDLEALRNEYDRTVAQLALDRASVAELTREAEERRQLLEQKRLEIEQLTVEVEAERSRQLQMLTDIDRTIELFETELDSLEREQARLRQILADQQRNTTSEQPAAMSWPVRGRISSLYGYRTHPITGAQKLHSGLDIAAPSGTPLVAAASGRVVYADWFGGYGLTVIIDHGGGIATLYAHQSRLGVQAGQQVSAGERIGYVGSTGQSTGPHVHFEVRSGGTPEDPLPWLGS